MKKLLHVPEVPIIIDEREAMLRCASQHKSTLLSIIDLLHENACDVYDALCIMDNLTTWLLAHFADKADMQRYAEAFLDLIEQNLNDFDA